jgi:hypothetical protein
VGNLGRDAFCSFAVYALRNATEFAFQAVFLESVCPIDAYGERMLCDDEAELNEIMKHETHYHTYNH